MHTGYGAGRGESSQQRPRFLCSRQAHVPCSAPTPRLTAGSFGCSAPGRSGRESPTPGSAYSRLSGGHTPARTENLGSQETGSKPSCKREGGRPLPFKRHQHGHQGRDTGGAAAASTLQPPRIPAQNAPCSARHRSRASVCQQHPSVELHGCRAQPWQGSSPGCQRLHLLLRPGSDVGEDSGPEWRTGMET